MSKHPLTPFPAVPVLLRRGAAIATLSLSGCGSPAVTAMDARVDVIGPMPPMPPPMPPMPPPTNDARADVTQRDTTTLDATEEAALDATPDAPMPDVTIDVRPDRIAPMPPPMPPMPPAPMPAPMPDPAAE